MIIGFTGTQENMTLEQFDVLYGEIERMNLMFDIPEAHHGDCIGGDFTFHAICMEEEIPIVIHPPQNTTKRAYCEGAMAVNTPKDYLVRNHDIVDVCDIMYVCPRTMEEQLRSGTWATWRYATKQGKEIILILPDGKIG